MYNTRIAPSPTGDLHIGTARTAYFNWLAARATGGKFILRIDDTDLQRSQPQYCDTITDAMNWLTLDADATFKQSQRFARYRSVADDLIAKNVASMRDGAVVLTAGNLPMPTSWQDQVGGNMTVSSDDVDIASGTVLIKSDGSPTYHFASVVDDIDMGVNYIIRGVDHIPNTPRQIMLFSLLGGQVPKFAHVGLICSKGKPLSKRDGSASLLSYKNAGYDADAMLNYLVRLGWGPKTDDKTTKVLPKAKMIEIFFDGGKMRSAYSNIDQSKLESFDRKYKAAKGIWRTAKTLELT